MKISVIFAALFILFSHSGLATAVDFANATDNADRPVTSIWNSHMGPGIELEEARKTLREAYNIIDIVYPQMGRVIPRKKMKVLY